MGLIKKKRSFFDIKVLTIKKTCSLNPKVMFSIRELISKQTENRKRDITKNINDNNKGNTKI